MGNSNWKWVWVKVVLISVVFILQGWCSEGCREQERLALLQLKHFFNSPDSLQDGVEGDENSDCCQWKSVECSNTTGRVITLGLYYTRDLALGEWYLNASLFVPFQELEWLDLSYNNIAGCLENEGFEKLSKLRKLKFLNLRQNSFNYSILSSLDVLSSLRALDLSTNKLEGIHAVKGLQKLSKLRNLQILDLNGNSFNNDILSSLHGFSSLRELYLTGNSGGGSTDFKDGKALLKFIGSLPSLKILHLYDNNFKRTMVSPAQVLQNYTNLEDLRLEQSDLHISLIQSVAELASLKRLSICLCNINGDFHGQGFPKLKNLEFLFMNDTELGNKYLQIIKLMPSLKVLSLSGCRLKSTIFVQGLCVLGHLQELYLQFNDLRGTLPWCLANMTSLQVFDVSYNQLTGSISSSPLQYLASIQDLILSNNHFMIPLSLGSFYNRTNLKIFHAENNQIYADDESHSLSAPKFQLNSLILSGAFSDGVPYPKFLYHQHDLQEVDLSHIKLRGEFPNWLLENNTKLEVLSLANNSLSGSFRMPDDSHINLIELSISHNFLDGHIPTKIGAFLPSLIKLDISHNALNGSIPSSFGDMMSLNYLDLSNNQLIGEIPEYLTMGCFSLQYLLLSNNHLQGHIFSKSFNLTQLMWLLLDGNHFIGEIPQGLSKCFQLSGVNFRGNNLSSKIPQWLGNLTMLKEIIMANNHFEGPMPTELCQLRVLDILDLSNNLISGNLPSCLNSRFLRYLVLAYNNLEGKIPTEFCQLRMLRLIDVSHNNLSGQIPPCFVNTSLNEDYDDYEILDAILRGDEVVKFTTKTRSDFYIGEPFRLIRGIDFSYNQLVGEIPLQIGYLTSIHTLNLSYNNLTGTIPATFSKLKQIESLDLSYNNLYGKIPPELIELTYLGTFSVAHNNLSGKIPEQIRQFATFSKSSYEGNPLLCGQPLHKCSSGIQSLSLTDNKESENTLVDMDSFYITFTVSYPIVFSGIIGALYVNPYWRRRWFYLIELWMTSCYYFIIDHVSAIFN